MMCKTASLKVVHLSSGHYAVDERILLKECQSLARAGHEVTLIAQYVEDTVLGGVQIKALRPPGSKLQRWTQTTWGAYRTATRLHAEVYHFHDPELIPLALWLSLRGKRVIYDAHENLPNTFPYKRYIPAFARGILGSLAGKIEDLAARCFSGVVAATPVIAKRFSSQNSNTVLVRNFPILEELGSGPTIPWNDRPPLVAYVGGTGPERGIQESVTAMSLLPQELNARLAIAGPPSTALRRKIARLDGYDRTELLGLLDRKGIASLLGATRVGLVPLHRMPNFVDALPVKLFEYMACGVPVVASDFPLWRQIVDGCQCGMLVNPQDSQDLARAIEYLLTHPEEARQMGERGRAAVERDYNWRTEERQLLAFYDSFVPQQLDRELRSAYGSPF
jgi:glycosyltransferase involved in cell wall biosynthesis